MISAKLIDGKADYSFHKSQADISHWPTDIVYEFSFSAIDSEWKEYFWADLFFMFVDSAAPDAGKQSGSAAAFPTSSQVLINGVPVRFEAYNIEGSNYFKLRDIAMVIGGTDKQFEIRYDGAENAIHITRLQNYTPDGSELNWSTSLWQTKTAVKANVKMYVDGKQVQMEAYNIGGYNYFKLRDVAKALDFSVTWDAKKTPLASIPKAAISSLKGGKLLSRNRRHTMISFGHCQQIVGESWNFSCYYQKSGCFSLTEMMGLV